MKTRIGHGHAICAGAKKHTSYATIRSETSASSKTTESEKTRATKRSTLGLLRRS